MCVAPFTPAVDRGGLSAEFNSLDAQREAAESYIQSPARVLGWKLIPTRYDDGGFSAVFRSAALQKLLADVDAGLWTDPRLQGRSLSRSLLDLLASWSDLISET